MADRPARSAVGARPEPDGGARDGEDLVLEEVRAARELAEAVRRQSSIHARGEDLLPGRAAIGRSRDGMAGPVHDVRQQRAVLERGHHPEGIAVRRRSSARPGPAIRARPQVGVGTVGADGIGGTSAIHGDQIEPGLLPRYIRGEEDAGVRGAGVGVGNRSAVGRGLRRRALIALIPRVRAPAERRTAT